MTEFDLIVVGAGTSGLPAAIAAADAGARVLLLDKRNDVGGMLHISGGNISGAGTRRQQERGIQDSPNEHFDDVMRISHQKANPAMVRIAVDAQGEMVDWLDSLGFEFDPDTPKLVYGHEAYRKPRTYWGVNMGRSIQRILEREIRKRVDSGAVTLRLGMRVARLVEDGGRVAGVAARPVDGGEEETFRGGAVALATGGFAANRDLVNRFLPPQEQTALTSTLDHAVGEGLVMAEAIGAGTTEYVGFLPSLAMIPDPDRPGYTLYWPDVHVNLVPQYRTQYEIWVNKQGERFIAEDVPSADARDEAMLAQPDQWMALVWDQRMHEVADPPLTSDADDWTRERIVEEAGRGRFIWKANSLRDLAARAGMDPDGLERTVAAYNAAVAAGQDSAFGRATLPLPIEQPPYYAVASQSGMLLTREGVRVDTDLRVLRPDGTPIPGLYAVGEVVGAAQFMGDGFAGGMSAGPALALGRTLGACLGAMARAMARL